MPDIKTPFNVSLLNLTEEAVKALPQVTSTDLIDKSRNMHPDGLFSTAFFGRLGEERRLTSFAWIDLRCTVIHPLIWYHLTKMREFYKKIAAGKAYATWDETVSDFEPATMQDGQTGYDFFISHYPKLKLQKNNSTKRNEAIDVIEKYRGLGDMPSRILVLPAGLRDIEITEDGRIQEDEINVIYRKILAISKNLSRQVVETTPRLVNSARYALQCSLFDLFELLVSIMAGKNKEVQGKVLSRRIFDGTRQVVTASDIRATKLGDFSGPGYNNTVIGMYQAMKAFRPKVLHLLKTGYLAKAFQGPSIPANLVDQKTLKAVSVSLSSTSYDRWTAVEGLETLINLYGKDYLAWEPIEVEGHYLALIYTDEHSFRVFSGLTDDQLKDDAFVKKCRPITLCEFLYTQIYTLFTPDENSILGINNAPGWNTRYPVADEGSCNPTFYYLRPTSRTKRMDELDDDGNIKRTAYAFPVWKAPLQTSMQPHNSTLGPMGMDFDGDMGSLNGLYMDDSVKDMRRMRMTWSAYITTSGKLMASNATDTVKYVLSCMTDIPEELLVK